MKFTCIAVDDDQANLELLSDYLASLGNYQLLKSFLDPIQALKYLNSCKQIDFIFMDIEMPKMSGLELSKIVRSKTHHLIITSGHPQYAVEAFEVDADAYLLKPFSLGRFALVLDRITSQTRHVMERENYEENDFFFIKNKNEKSNLVKVKFDEIIAIESIQNYVSIYTICKTIIAHITLTKIKEILKSRNYFIQVHRSFIISKDYLEEVENNIIKMSNNLRISVGENYRDGLSGFIRNKTIKTGRN